MNVGCTYYKVIRVKNNNIWRRERQKSLSTVDAMLPTYTIKCGSLAGATGRLGGLSIATDPELSGITTDCWCEKGPTGGYMRLGGKFGGCGKSGFAI